MSEPTKGQTLLDDLTAWIGRYITASADTIYLLAVWALHTWCVEYLDATPYLCITGPAGSGKTRIMEVLRDVCRGPVWASDMKPAPLKWRVHNAGGLCSVFLDESEILSKGGAGEIRSFMNSGYRPDGVLPIKLPNGETVDLKTYCAKAVSLIGDMTNTMRSRSILVRTVAAPPKQQFRFVTAEGEAKALALRIQGKGVWLRKPASEYVDSLADYVRDQEIWSALFAVLTAIGADREHRDRLERIAVGSTVGKNSVSAKYYKQVESEAAAKAGDGPASMKAIRDLLTVVKPTDTKGIWSDEAVARMLALPLGGWAFYEGSGLTTKALARLVGPWIETYQIRAGGRGTVEKRGYRRADLDAVRAVLFPAPADALKPTDV